jgi:hypothetical protein
MDKRCFPLRGRASEGRVAGLRGWHGGLRRQPCAKRAARAGAEALTWWAPDQGLRLVGGGKPTTMRQASSRVLENPAIANYRFRALKVSLGRNITAS